ncbi:hypothetical protein K435DRAFT_902877 [Dendrothele bispora CBS 962.96]|uniref:Plastocyanin-like domain-containing protein n=1 Tax=Dendrothele bispora (strain CBS 962.96) TaxID=1314807 RepID=A0A4S8LVP6_DENBC|nr:hypothetical protein K435DRAFT_902877 [Dendrothele bispora CBS 962.96]
MTMQPSSDNKNLDTDNVLAVFHYVGAPDADPTGKPNSFVSLLDQRSELIPLVNPEAPGGSGPADTVINLNLHYDTDTGELEWTINDIKYESPDLPTLLNIMVNIFTNEDQLMTSEHTFVLKRDNIVELQVHGSADGHKHPFHLHGPVFSVVQGMTGAPNFVVAFKFPMIFRCYRRRRIHRHSPFQG